MKKSEQFCIEGSGISWAWSGSPYQKPICHEPTGCQDKIRRVSFNILALTGALRLTRNVPVKHGNYSEESRKTRALVSLLGNI